MRISRLQLIAYALPALPLAALTLPLYIIVPTFYSETLGLSLASVGAALLVVRVFDAINDPLVGWAADRMRPALGRRRAVFAASLPLCALGTIMLFWPPPDAGASYLLGWGLILSAGYTAALLPLSAWGAELTGDYHERSRIAGAREAFTLLGTLLAIALPFSIGFGEASTFHGLALLGIVAGVGLLLLGITTVALVPEPQDASSKRVPMAHGLGAMAANRPFLRLLSAFLINGLANAIPATLFLYFVSDVLETPHLRGGLLFLYFLAGIAGVPLALLAAARLGKHRAWCLSMLAACFVFAFAPLLGPGDVRAFAVICALTGIALGFDLALPPSIQADVVDVDTASSGEQRTGLYFAFWSLATKTALALSVGIAFPLVATFGFEPGAEEQEPAALLSLALTYSWLPITLKLGAVSLMWNFPLDRTLQATLRRQIEARAGG